MNIDALYNLTHGVYVLGADDGGRPVGSAVDAVMQVASKPVVLALPCHNGSYTDHRDLHRVDRRQRQMCIRDRSCIEKSGRFGLSVLGRGVDPFVIANFGFRTSRTADKWAEVPHFVEDGLPYLQNCIAVMTCRVLEKQVFESNTLFTAEVTDCRNVGKDEPLTYYDYRASFKNEVLKFLPNILNKKEK